MINKRKHCTILSSWKQTLTTKALIHENYQEWPQEILTPLSVEPIYDSTYISGQALIADVNTIVA